MAYKDGSCLNPKCERTGSDNMRGLCGKCYSKPNVRKKHARPPKPRGGARVKGKKEKPKKIELQKECKAKGCTKLGRENAGGYCIKCYAARKRDVITGSNIGKPASENKRFAEMKKADAARANAGEDNLSQIVGNNLHGERIDLMLSDIETEIKEIEARQAELLNLRDTLNKARIEIK